MKTRFLTIALVAHLAVSARAEMPTLTATIDGSEVVLEWEAMSLNPGSSTELFYGFQVQKSEHLTTWEDLGAPIATRVGGGTMSHSVRVPLAGAHYFRLRLLLDLSGQNLAGADLSGIDFGEADLSGVDLSGVDLAGADLSEARLDSGISSIGGLASRNIHDSLPALPYQVNAAGFVPEDAGTGFGGVSGDTLLVMPSPNATSAEINALLAAHGGTVVGGYGGDSDEGQAGLLIVRLAPGDLPAALLAFEADTGVAAVTEDRFLYNQALPDLTNAHADWTNWNPQSADASGSWALRLCRVPQMWNFNEALYKRNFTTGPSAYVTAGMVEGGYYTNHDETRNLLVLIDGSGSVVIPPYFREHGAGTSAVIGGDHDGKGMDGVNPFVTLFGVGSNFAVGAVIPGTGAIAVGEFFTDLVVRLLARTGDRVINISMAGAHTTDPNVAMPPYVVAHAMMFQNAIDTRDAPIIVKSAGNDGYNARWQDGINYTALANNHPSILVVEALQGKANGGESLVTDWDGPAGPLTHGSNFGGNISAPGFGVLSASYPTSDYFAWSGTSFAAPIVSGIISYLYAIEPSLSKEDVMEIVALNSHPVAGASPRIDAYDCALSIDDFVNGQKVARMLLDIDDGTHDGNRRVRLLAKTDPEADPKTFDTLPSVLDDWGKIGDDVVDMADFRRFRDWNLIADSLANNDPTLRLGLDGPPEHLKNDPNRNRISYITDDHDGHYPRTDFNGDGLTYGETRRKLVQGFFQGDFLNDLECLQRRFVDAETNYKAEDLPGLIHSSDLHISLYWFMLWNELAEDDFDINQVRIRIVSRNAATERVYFLDVPEGEADRSAHFIITLPAPDQHRIYVCGDAGTTILGEVGENELVLFDEYYGRDLWFAPRVRFDHPDCEPENP